MSRTPGHVGDRRRVDRLQRVADEVAVVGAGVRRPHDAAVQHAVDAHVVDEDRVAARLRRQVDARHRTADEAMVRDVLDRRRRIEDELDASAGDERPEADRAIAGDADAVAHDDVVDRHVEHRRRAADEPRARLRGRAAQRRRVDLDRRARDRRALVRRERRVAHHERHGVHRDVELVGDDLRQRGPQPGAEIDMTVQRDDAIVVEDAQQDLDAFGRIGRHDRRLAVRGVRRRRGGADDDERAVALEQVATRCASSRLAHAASIATARAHRVDDLDVRAAAAQVVRQRRADLGVGRARPGVEQRDRRDDHAVQAVAALRRLRVDERLLDAMQRAAATLVRGQAFERGHGASVDAVRGDHARARDPAVDEHGARAALAEAAAVLRAVERKVVAQHVQQRRARRRVEPHRAAVDDQRHARCPAIADAGLVVRHRHIPR